MGAMRANGTYPKSMVSTKANILLTAITDMQTSLHYSPRFEGGDRVRIGGRSANSSGAGPAIKEGRTTLQTGGRRLDYGLGPGIEGS